MSKATNRLSAAIDGGAMSSKRFSGSAGIAISGAISLIELRQLRRHLALQLEHARRRAVEAILELRRQRTPQRDTFEGPGARRAPGFQRRNEDVPLLGGMGVDDHLQRPAQGRHFLADDRGELRLDVLGRSLHIGGDLVENARLALERHALIGTARAGLRGLGARRLQLEIGGFGAGARHIAEPARRLHLGERRLAGAHGVRHDAVH